MATQTDQSKQLKSLLVLFRHGERFPKPIYPNDPVGKQMKSLGPLRVRSGELTVAGVMQMLVLGRSLGARYSNFMKSLKPEQVHVRASSEHRCHTSATEVLAELLKVMDGNPQKSVQIECVPREQDTLYPVYEDDWLVDYMGKFSFDPKGFPEAAAIHERYTHVIRAFKQYSGLPVKEADDLVTYGRIFREQRAADELIETQNLRPVRWFTDKIWRDVQEMRELVEYHSCYAPVVRSHRLKPIADYMIDFLVQSQAEITNRKLQVLATHDVTLEYVRELLDVREPGWVSPYGYGIILEVWECQEAEEEKLAVKVWECVDCEKFSRLTILDAAGKNQVQNVDQVVELIAHSLNKS